MADRHGPQRVPLGRWVEEVNDGQISQGAIVASGADAGLGDLSLPGQSGGAVVPGERSSVVVPSGARASKAMSVRPADLLVLAPGDAVETDGGDVVAPAGTVETDATAFFPGSPRAIKMMDPGAPTREDIVPWFAPGGGDVALTVEDASVVVLTGGRSPSALFGDEADAFGPVEEGSAIETENTVFAMVGDSVIDDEGPLSQADVFGAGVAAPLSGATFTMAVLSTPDATVADQSANPLVGMSTDELLQREETQGLLRQAGVTDADDIEWLAGPERLSIEDDGDVSLLGSDPESGLQTFAAVVGGAEGPWLVAVHAVRVTTDDHVVVIGLQRRPVGSAEDAGDLATLADTRQVRFGRDLTRQAAERLESG